MAQVNLVDKRHKFTLSSIIKFQFLTHSYLTSTLLSESELDCLTLLGLKGEQDLADFCVTASSDNIFKSTQTVRNCLTKMEKIGFIVKEGKSKKKIFINPDLKIQCSGNILLDFKFVHIDTQKI